MTLFDVYPRQALRDKPTSALIKDSWNSSLRHVWNFGNTRSVILSFARSDAQGPPVLELVFHALNAGQLGDFIVEALALFFVPELAP